MMRAGLAFGLGQGPTVAPLPLAPTQSRIWRVERPFAGGAPPAIETLTYDDLVGRVKVPTVVTDASTGHRVAYYPTAADVLRPVSNPQPGFEEPGGNSCRAWQLFFTGFDTPWATGTVRIEPGVFHPSKTWSLIVSESEKLRARPVDTSRWQSCGLLRGMAQSPDPRIVVRSGDWLGTTPGSTTSVRPESTTADFIGGSGCAFRHPLPHLTDPAVVRDFRMWMESRGGEQSFNIGPFKLGGALSDLVYCYKLGPAMTVTDQRTRHTYQQRPILLERIGSGGRIAERVSTQLQGPIIEGRLATGADVFAGARACAAGCVSVGLRAGPAAAAECEFGCTAITEAWRAAGLLERLGERKLNAQAEAIVKAVPTSAFRVRPDLPQTGWFPIARWEIGDAVRNRRWPPPFDAFRWSDTKEEDSRIASPKFMGRETGLPGNRLPGDEDGDRKGRVAIAIGATAAAAAIAFALARRT